MSTVTVWPCTARYVNHFIMMAPSRWPTLPCMKRWTVSFLQDLNPDPCHQRKLVLLLMYFATGQVILKYTIVYVCFYLLLNNFNCSKFSRLSYKFLMLSRHRCNNNWRPYFNNSTYKKNGVIQWHIQRSANAPPRFFFWHYDLFLQLLKTCEIHSSVKNINKSYRQM